MKLKDMEIHEVSFVDVPANKRRFLLIKRQDGKSIALSIETDGTRDGTRVRLNGEALPDLMDFHFSYNKGKDTSPVSCSYSINDGLGRVKKPSIKFWFPKVFMQLCIGSRIGPILH